MNKIAELVPDVCRMMSEGISLRAACRQLGIGESSMRYHLNKSEEAFAQSARARELGCDALADECIDIADDKTIDPADKRIMVDTRIRLIGKWSQRYSDKLKVETQATVTHKHDLDKLSDSELADLETILAKSERREGGDVEAEPASLH